MRLNPVAAPLNLEFKRELLCWRGREFDEHYDCVIKSVGEGTVRIEFDSCGLEFSSSVAYELAFSLSEAIAFDDQPDAQTATAALREDNTLLQRKFRLIAEWHFTATGEVPYKNPSTELLDETEGETLVTIRTLRPGGIEMEFEWLSYSFSRNDAAWIQEALLEVSGQLLAPYPRACLYDSIEKKGHKIRG